MSSVARKRIPPPRDPAEAVYATIDRVVAEAALDYVELSAEAVALAKRLSKEFFDLASDKPLPGIWPGADDGLTLQWAHAGKELDVQCRAGNAVEARAYVVEGNTVYPSFIVRSGEDLWRAWQELSTR